MHGQTASILLVPLCDVGAFALNGLSVEGWAPEALAWQVLVLVSPAVSNVA